MAEKVTTKNLKRVANNLLALMREFQVVSLVDAHFQAYKNPAYDNPAPALLLQKYMDELQRQAGTP